MKKLDENDKNEILLYRDFCEEHNVEYNPDSLNGNQIHMLKSLIRNKIVYIQDGEKKGWHVPGKQRQGKRLNLQTTGKKFFALGYK